MIVKRKPIVLEAIRWDGTEETRKRLIEWMPGQLTYLARNPLQIHTAEGLMMARIGDTIIKGTQGEFWPCKPAAFEATYEVIEQ